MNVSRILSLAVFVLVVAAFRWLSPAELWSAQPALVVWAMLAAAAAAVVHWCLCRVLVDKSLSRLHRQVSGLADSGVALRTGWRGWPQGLTGAIDRTATALRSRVDDLSRRAEEAEARTRFAEGECRRLETILRTVSDGVIVTDSDDRVVLANDAAARALGLGAIDARRQPISRLVNNPELVRVIRETRFTGDTHNPRRVELRLGENGHASLFELSLTCAADPGKDVCGVVAVLRDVTRHQQLAAVKNDLVCGVSHELRTPLSSIHACAEMLADGEANDEATRREFYTMIQTETQRLSGLIDNVLNISRIESGMLQVQRERVSLPALIRDALDTVRPAAQAKSIALADRHQGPACSLYADRDLVLQAMVNLLSNAIKYTLPGGTVGVEVEEDEASKTATIHVMDTGVGIPTEELPRLGEKFHRIKEHRKLAPGTGLGLNLVKLIVETVHHGVVSVRSAVGRGTTFSVTFPLAEPERWNPATSEIPTQVTPMQPTGPHQPVAGER